MVRFNRIDRRDSTARGYKSNLPHKRSIVTKTCKRDENMHVFRYTYIRHFFAITRIGVRLFSN